MLKQLCLVWAAFILGNLALAQTGNLIRNGNFERYSSGGISDWTTSCSQPIRLTTASPKFDRTSLEITDIDTARSCSATSTSFAVLAGKSYVVDGWVKQNDLNGVISTPSFYLLWFNSTGGEISRVSSPISTTEGVWGRFSKAMTAPSGAVSAKLLLYSNTSASQVVLFDGIHVAIARVTPTNEVNRYVAPAAAGTGSGTSSSNPAKFNSSTFWAGVKSQLSSTPVQVIFLAGKYTIKSSAETLLLSQIGHATNGLTLRGTDPYSVRLVSSSAATAYFDRLMLLDGSQNITIANLHFRTESAFDIGYGLLITNDSMNIRLENISSVDTIKVSYGIVGFHYGTNGVSLKGSEFLRVGYDGHQHFMYNFREVSNITVDNSVFEDSTGAFLRCRDLCSSFRITNSAFRATGTWGSSDETRYPHFIELAVFNDVLYQKPANQSQQEWFWSGFTATGNSFRYAAPRGERAKPFSIHHSGFKPWDGTKFRNHLISSSEASTLLYGSLSSRRALIQSKFGLNVATQFVVHSNTYENAIYVFELESRASYGAAAYYPAADSAGSGMYDISNLFQ